MKLADVVQIAVEASRPVIDEAGHELTVELADEALCLNADPQRLAQVLSNLLNNAAKYTPEGGRIRLSAKASDGEAIISVRDTGIGIPSEMRSRIFEMFAQVERPMEKGYPGLGIGLTLVKSLVEMHDGSVSVHSDGPNRGSDFTLRLPLDTDGDFAERESGTRRAARVQGRRRVLVVDDNIAAANTLSMVVKMLGNDVRTASDGLEAIEVASEFRPDVILMDLRMPRMNGYDAARRIREQDWSKDTMLVALTGWGQDDDRERTKEAGFDHHLVKPAEPQALQGLLATKSQGSQA